MRDVYREAVLNLYATRASYDTEPGTRHPRVAHQLVAASGLLPGETVLDVATGTGLFAFEAAARIGSRGRIVAFDFSDTMLAQARRKAATVQNIDFRMMDVASGVFPPASFDRVFCCEALVLFQDALAVLEGWHAVLRPGGSVSFTCTHENSYFGIALKRAMESVLGKDCPPQMHEPLGSPEKIAIALDQAGFREQRITSENSGRFRPLDEVRCTRGFVSLMFKGAKAATSLSDEQFDEVCSRFQANLSDQGTPRGIWESTSLHFVHAS